ncbi:MAG: DUF177 domain-containing protein [Piscirickettsiaceae bacterium]|nr:DUF177 domain-containing protein [Piscirickettsiaceae bacterium]
MPEKIHPLRHAQDGVKLVGNLQTHHMLRLGDALHNMKGSTASVDMIFDVDKDNIPYLQGKFTSLLTFICERCMHVMSLTITAECLLALIQNEHKIKALSEQYEPWLINSNEPIQLNSIVEDELILALPSVPKHDFNCLSMDAWHSEAGETKRTMNVTSPFAVLSALKLKD